MPRTKGFDYQTYLASREWSLLRERVRERSGGKCEHCFMAPQQAVHHLTYARIGDELLSDLMAVCNPCHEYFSGKASANPADSYTVSPALGMPSFPDWPSCHYLLPRPWVGLEDGKHRVRRVVCREGCIWCKEVEPDWLMFIEQLVLVEEPYDA